MTDVLVVGWSDIVRRRVLPALDSLPEVAAIHLASHATGVALAAETAKAARHFTGDLREALDACPDALVYVSGINTAHASRVVAALSSGHDVVVDKPAVLTADDRRACLDAAANSGRLLAEATVWSQHSQVHGLVQRLNERGLHPHRIDSIFTIPALPANNFRTSPRAGGGAVADMGAYAMSPGRLFGTGELAELSATVTQESAAGLDVGFHLTATYSDGLSLHGMFSLEGEYANRLHLQGDEWEAVLQPAFSSKPDAELTVGLVVEGADESFIVAPSDPFAVFLHSVLVEIADGRRAEATERTALSTADVLGLATAAGIDYSQRWASLAEEGEAP